MSDRVERIRRWLLGSAILLLLVIAAFIGSARYLRHQIMKQVPIRLALNILRETANPTYCQSDAGRTKFCIHAARSVEYNNGKMTLHDVSITLGQPGAGGDRIYGDEFDYDRKDQVVRATGVVHIDLHGAGTASRQPSSANVIHVTTSGLVYMQKLGVASTNEPIEFEADGLTGHAVGADYSSDAEVLALHSAVNMSGVENGRQVSMTAATAEFDQRSQQALLTQATYDSDGRKAAAEQATLYRRPDGTLSRIDAKGNVTLVADGGRVEAQHADIALSATRQPETVVLTGNVKYESSQPLRQLSGQADSATINFAGQTKAVPDHAVFAGAVQMVERTRASVDAREPWSTRTLKATHVEAELTTDGAGTTQVQNVSATGNPQLTVVNRGSQTSKASAGTTELSADLLGAHFIDAGVKQSMQIDTIMGRGHALLRQISANGKVQTVSSDSLDAKLRPNAGAHGATAGDRLADSLESSVQQGHVQMTRRAPAKGGAVSAPDVVETALADRAAYDGDSDSMKLSGGVQVSDAGSRLWASQVTLDRTTGDAHAAGSVKVSYLAESGHAEDEPTHVIADRADLIRATGVATFHGAPVRMWQGGTQVLAPVIELSNAERRLEARGDAGSTGEQVRTVLTGGGANGKTSAESAPATCMAASTKAAGVANVVQPSAKAVRITSGGLTYSGVTGQAAFTGGFRADTADGTIQANEGIAYLQQSPTPTKHVVVSMSGALDRIVATGRVQLEQPGLKATGARLVYTASDRTAILTGDAKNPPRAVREQGTTTGVALRLRTTCNSGGSGTVEGYTVEALGGTGQRVQTDATVREQLKGKRRQ